MANIIDATYFEVGNLYIPNNKDIMAEPVESPTSATDIEHFITVYERELLLGALGVDLYSELKGIIDADELNDVGNEKWADLVNGRTYTNSSGERKVWEGLKGVNKQSVIAFFVFQEYLRNDHETYATVGTVKSESKNAQIINSTPKFIKAHIKFIKAYQGDVPYYNYPKAVVVMNGFGSVGIDYYSEDVRVSLFNYLVDSNEEDETAFPDFTFKFYDNLNSFGI